MATIRGTCPIHGSIELSASDMLIIRRPLGQSTYSFTCPEGNHGVTKPCPPDTMTFLVLGGVPVCDMTGNLAEHVGPPITEADVHDFIMDLHLTPAHLICQLAEG